MKERTEERKESSQREKSGSRAGEAHGSFLQAKREMRANRSQPRGLMPRDDSQLRVLLYILIKSFLRYARQARARPSLVATAERARRGSHGTEGFRSRPTPISPSLSFLPFFWFFFLISSLLVAPERRRGVTQPPREPPKRSAREEISCEFTVARGASGRLNCSSFYGSPGAQVRVHGASTQSTYSCTRGVYTNSRELGVIVDN